MPCMCWFTPEKASHRLIKGGCQLIIDEMKFLDSQGDPDNMSMRRIHSMLDDMYTGKCSEKPKEKE